MYILVEKSYTPGKNLWLSKSPFAILNEMYLTVDVIILQRNSTREHLTESENI